MWVPRFMHTGVSFWHYRDVVYSFCFRVTATFTKKKRRSSTTTKKEWANMEDEMVLKVAKRE
jgi:hypothetical protein